MKVQNGTGLVTKIPIKNKRGEVCGHKEVVTYRGLLAQAHNEQLKSIETTVVQLPTKDNRLTAVFQAKVMTSKGTFTGIGDANPENVNSQIVPHLIRMAETRAKARALRDAVNIGVVCLEELGGELGSDALGDGNVVEDSEVQIQRQPEKGNGEDRQAKAGPQPTIPMSPKPQTTAQNHGTNATRQSETSHPATLPAETRKPSQPVGQAGPTRGPEPMSENQRRYLFRLLAKRSVFGDEAKAWLCRALNVRVLKDASKNAASVLIDRLVQEDREDDPADNDKGNGRDQEVADAGGA